MPTRKFPWCIRIWNNSKAGGTCNRTATQPLDYRHDVHDTHRTVGTVGTEDAPSAYKANFNGLCLFLKVTDYRAHPIIWVPITLAEPIPITTRQPPNTRQASRGRNLEVRCHFG